MPIYQFEVQSHLTPRLAMERVKELVGPKRTFLGEFKRSFGAGEESGRPFIGSVEADSFRVRRDIRYRNSFLPLVWGHIGSIPMGSRLRVTMFLHPLVAVFMLVWFSGVGVGALAFFNSPPNSASHWAGLVPIGMLVFGVALVCGGFFPEAIRARRILEQALAANRSA